MSYEAKSNKILQLSEIRENREKEISESREKDLQDFLLEATQIQQNIPVLRRGITLVTQQDAEILIRTCLIKELKNKELLNSVSFTCIDYIAGLLMELFCKTPQYWTAFDFLEESNRTNNPYVLQKGADTCFLISSYFEKRGDWRAMKLGYYRAMGISLYSSFYYRTKKEIGFYMSKNFLSISEIVKDGLKTLEKTN